MSNPFLEPPGGSRLGVGTTGRLGVGGLGEQRLGVSQDFNAPVLGQRTLTQPVTSDLNNPPTRLADLALGQAKQMLDAVRDRKVSWQQAKPFLETLSTEDKRTLAATRTALSIDEKRALGIDSFEGMAKLMGGGGGGGIGGVLHGIKDTASNFAGDVTTFVKDVPAGLVKTGGAIGADIKTVATTNPLESSSILASLTGHELHKSATQEEIINPTLKTYADTYGPAFHGDIGKTLGKIQDHPLGPVLDLLTIASAGTGATLRVGNAISKVEKAGHITQEATAAGAPRVWTMGKYDSTNETYQPLGINMEHYVRPTTQQIKNEPWMNHFSFIHNPDTGETLFGPTGSSHSEIFDALGDMGTLDAWGRRTDDAFGYLESHPGIIHGTGIFDPATGKVGAININPEEFGLTNIQNAEKITNQVRKEADDTYITKSQLKDMSKENRKGTVQIKEDTATNRYDPLTGEQLGPTFHVTAEGKRIGSNFPDQESAFAFAQSQATGGVLRDVLVNELREYYEMTLDDMGNIVPGPTKTMKVPIGRETARAPSLRNPLTPRTRVEPLRQKSSRELAIEGFTQRPQGSLIDVYERIRDKSHLKEMEGIINEVVTNILTDPTMTTRAAKKERFLSAFKDMGEGLSETARRDYEKIFRSGLDAPEFAGPARTLAHALGVTAREASDLVRAGAVFLRPAYIPNNWAGNGFLNAIHQGVYAPLNLAKSLVMDKHLGVLNTRALDQSMGYNAARIMPATKGSGYAAAVTDPVAKLMGDIADRPFRRAAWLHEARRSGYKTLYDVKRLLDQAHKERTKFEERGGVDADGEPIAWDPKQTPALAEVGKIARAAQEEIIKFGKYSDIERGVLRNLIFVYSWMRGAARYFGRFPMQHPIQAAAYMNAANIGQNWLSEEMGGVPNFLIGAIPVGKDDQGNTTVINPFSVNPLGTGQELFSAAGSVAELLTNPDEFNKYSQTDPIGLMNPLIQNAIESYTGGRPIQESIPDTIAALRLKQNLEHPGRGQVYPTTQEEALGQYFIGSMFPRKTSQAAITRSLQRERADQPEQRIDDEVKVYEDATGGELPKEFIDMYREDLKKLDRQKDFQHEYAKDHGSQGFANMPASNRAEAALDYLAKYHIISPNDLQQIETSMENIKSDEEMNNLANTLWRLTGAGTVKDRWDSIVRGVADTQQLTPARP